MLQAVEAIIKEGRIQPVEPICMEENARFLLDTHVFLYFFPDDERLSIPARTAIKQRRF